jgi:TPR repeat protein
MTLDELVEAAHQGVPEAQYVVGIFYGNGIGVATDKSLAEHWFQKSAQNGFAAGQYELSLLLQSRDEQNLGAAVDWLRKSALQGFPPAQYLYSLYCEGGVGMAPDPKEALRVCLLAANRDYRPAVRRAASMLEQGIGATVDLEQAFGWYRRAAELGDADAAASVGRMYANGIGVGKDEGKALQWLKEGQKRGSPWALLALSSVYRFGELGESIDTSKADELAKQAQSQIERRAERGRAHSGVPSE